ncbi:MAG: ATP-binding protein [Anaerolineae bacterium]
MEPWADYQAQQWKYLLEITRAIAARLDLDTVLARALRYAVDLVRGEAGLVALRGANDVFHFAARYGIEARLLSRLEPLLTEIPLTLEQDQNVRWRFPQLQMKFDGIVDASLLRLQQVMAIPLIASENLLGIIYVFRDRRELLFTALDQDALAGFADHVAIAIEHARLYRAQAARAHELSVVIEGSAQGVLIAEPGEKIRSMNRSLERLTHWARGEAEGRNYREVLQLMDERGQTVPLPTFAGMSHTAPTAEGFIKQRDGARGAYTHVTLAPLYDETRQLTSLLINVVDVTTVREADELKTSFLAGLSHDLKTPLALIRGYAETLRRTDVEWDRKTLDESLAVIQDEAEYLTHLVNTLLDASQLQYGSLNLQWKSVRADELAKKVVERFQVTRPGYRWVLVFPADFPTVPGDPERVREVLQNLVSNAVKYSPRGSTITVGGWVDPERVGLFVRDEGPGIPVEEQARIFERFTRGRSYSAQRAEGAGLGLYLSRAIVEQHGGRIWMENLPEKGAAFYLTFPRENSKFER